MLLHSNPLVDKCLHVEEPFFFANSFLSMAVLGTDFTPVRRNSRRLSISLELGANLVEVGVEDLTDGRFWGGNQWDMGISLNGTRKTSQNDRF